MDSNWELTVHVLKEFLQAFNDRDLDKIMSFFHEDCILEMPKGPHPWGDRYEGIENVRNGLASRLDGLNDLNYGNDRHWVVDNFGVSEWKLTGMLQNGEKLEVNDCDHIEFRGDKILKKNSFWKIVK